MAWLDRVRIEPLSPPVARAGGPYRLIVGDDLILDGSGSSDANEDIVSYQWDLNGDGRYGDASGPRPMVPYSILGGLGYAPGIQRISLRVTDSLGATAESTGSVEVLPVSPPSISRHPAVWSGVLGGMAHFSVTADGTPPLAYQWLKDGVFLPGAQSSSLTISNVQYAHEGSYSVAVVGRSGVFVVSSAATLSVAPPVQAPCCDIPFSNLIGWWRGDGNSMDVMGGVDGLVSPGVGYGPGVSGSAFRFDGSSGVVEFPAAPFDRFATLSVWVRTTRRGVAIIDGGDILCSCPTWRLGLDAEGRARYEHWIDIPDYGYVGTVGNTQISDGQWHQLTAVHDNADRSLRLYVDGRPESENSVLSPLNPTAKWAIGERGAAQLGRGTAFGLPDSIFEGFVDDLMLYDRELGPAQVEQIYRSMISGSCATCPTSRPAVLSSKILTGANGERLLSGESCPGVMVRVEAADSLGSTTLWYLLGCTPADDSGTFRFVDAAQPATTARFYRVR